jgi:hypothetical protein
MKQNELRKLIKEEIKNLNEGKWNHLKPYSTSISNIHFQLKKLRNEMEDKGPIPNEFFEILEAFDNYYLATTRNS